MSNPTVHLEKLIQTTPAQIFAAFTNATALREWLCDVATVLPKPGGRIYLAWYSGYFSAGTYTSLEAGKSLAFTWRGPQDGETSQVQVNLIEVDGGTQVSLNRSGPVSGYPGKDPLQGVTQDWQEALENLASVLETGQDLRIVRRPMLGFYMGDFNAEIATKLGTPVSEGLRLDSTLEGYGAHTAGLRKDDVIVRMGKLPVDNSYASFLGALQGKRAGDVLEVEFYRGPDKHTVQMTLSPRPIPEIPWEPSVLAERIEKSYSQVYSALAKCFEDVTEAEASTEPEPGEWSANGVLAHLVQGERWQIMYLADLVSGQERWADDFTGNNPASIQATLAAFPNYTDLLNEFRSLQAEIVAFIAALPAEFMARKGSYWRIGYNLLEWPAHSLDHLEQIRAAIGKARQMSELRYQNSDN